MFFSVQALERPEYAALECAVYTGTVVPHPEYPFQVFPSA
jgi:hypothetical protein